jgi:hypothetical protein
MSQEGNATNGLESWTVIGKSLAFVYGVPIGIGLGAIAGALIEILHGSHSTAWGLLIGIVGGGLFGGLLARHDACGDYKWTHSQVVLPSDTKWDVIVGTLNAAAAIQHYMLVRREDDYATYAPTLVRSVVAGPLTVSGEYLSVVVTQVDATTITITGPCYMVGELENAATEATPSSAEAS